MITKTFGELIFFNTASPFVCSTDTVSAGRLQLASAKHLWKRYTSSVTNFGNKSLMISFHFTSIIQTPRPLKPVILLLLWILTKYSEGRADNQGYLVSTPKSEWKVWETLTEKGGLPGSSLLCIHGLFTFVPIVWMPFK